MNVVIRASFMIQGETRSRYLVWNGRRAPKSIFSGMKWTADVSAATKFADARLAGEWLRVVKTQSKALDAELVSEK